MGRTVRDGKNAGAYFLKAAKDDEGWQNPDK
jgi:hypothetical protein